MRRQRCGERPIGAAGRQTMGALWRLWAVAAVAAGCAAVVEPGADNLMASFAAQIGGVESVSGVEQTGDALTFIET